MGVRCIFVLFMIFNAILGLTGLSLLGSGIALSINHQKVVGSDLANNAFIAMIIIGVYITTILILGACSWKKSRVLIAYFVLILLLIIAEIVLIIIVTVAKSKYYDQYPGTKNEAFDLQVKILLYIFSISFVIAALSYTFSTIYFCLLKKESDPQLYSEVRNMDELNAVQQYQNF